MVAGVHTEGMVAGVRMERIAAASDSNGHSRGDLYGEA
jgi:hypothetical protein